MTLAESLLAQCRCGGFCVEGWVCEAHPWLGWPHDDCAGPGMPCSQPIRRCPTSGETFITSHEMLDLLIDTPNAEAASRVADYVRGLGIAPEAYDWVESVTRRGWTLVRRPSGLV